MSRSEPIVRPATASDFSWIMALLEGSGLPTVGVTDPICQFLVAEVGSNPAGCGALEHYGREALLRSIAVDARSRATGVGRSVVESLLATARRKGIREVILLTTTAAEYFSRLGFKTIDRREVPESLRPSAELRGACPASATVMRLDL